MICLRCRTTEMELKPRGSGTDTFEIDVCPTCAGIWLDAKELSRMDDNFFVDVETIDFAARTATADDEQLTCPRCEDEVALSKVHPKKHPELVVDTCPVCHGFWLDKDELETMRSVSDKLLIASLFDDDQ